MRIRVLLATAAIAIFGALGLPGVAHAQEATPPKPTEAGKECIEKLEKGGAIDDCQKAPSPILPATNEIVWGAAAFLVLYILLQRVAWPGMKKAMEARSERIRNSLDEADRAAADAQSVLEEYQRQLADAKGEAGRIIEEARQAADAMRHELMTKAESDAAATHERAQADIQVAIDRATADLRSQVAALAIEAAEMVVGNSLRDRDAQVQLVENFINQVGSTN